MTAARKVRDAGDLVGAGSSEAPVHALQSIKVRMRRYSRWLNVKHPYNGDIKRTLGNAGSVNAPKLAEYIACSAPIHLGDGWNYLSRAFEASSRGDRNTAYHLAYYAELRAAMSLLATEGIGIFSNWHVALDKNWQPTRMRTQSTHTGVWDILSAWSRVGRAEKLLFTISLDAKQLAEWLAVVGVGEKDRALIAGKWLRTLGCRSSDFR